MMFSFKTLWMPRVTRFNGCHTSRSKFNKCLIVFSDPVFADFEFAYFLMGTHFDDEAIQTP